MINSRVSKAKVPKLAAGRPIHAAARRRTLTALMFILPFMVFFCAFYIVPLVVDFHLALFAGAGISTTFVGLKNFMTVFTDNQFYRGLLTVLLFAVIQIPIMTLIALCIALLLSSPYARASKFFRFAVFLPYAVPGVVSALTWGYLYTPGISPLDGLVRSLGVKSFSFLASGLITVSIMNPGWKATNSCRFELPVYRRPRRGRA